jgi:hypothetical protein
MVDWSNTTDQTPKTHASERTQQTASKTSDWSIAIPFSKRATLHGQTIHDLVCQDMTNTTITTDHQNVENIKRRDDKTQSAANNTQHLIQDRVTLTQQHKMGKPLHPFTNIFSTSCRPFLHRSPSRRRAYRECPCTWRWSARCGEYDKRESSSPGL